MKSFLVISILVLLIVCSTHGQQLVIDLHPGTNIISINVTPPEEMFNDEGRLDVELMFDQLRRPNGRHALVTLHNQNALFYAPAWDFNNIPFYDLQEGYFVQVEEEVRVEWEGERIDANEIIIIDRDDLGGNGVALVPYYPTYPLSATADDFYVVGDFVDNIIIACNESGECMIPEFGFSNMNPWEPGEGYWIEFILPWNGEIEFSYPEERDEELIWYEPGDHYQLQDHADLFMGVFIPEIEAPEGFEFGQRDQIAVHMDNGSLFGFGDVRNEDCGFTIYGYDEGDEGDDFPREGEEFNLNLVYWDDDQEEEYNINVERIIDGNLQFNPNGHVVIAVSIDIGNEERELEMELRDGWNMISINVVPPEEMWVNEDGPDIVRMMERFEDEDGMHLEIMKDQNGQFYVPEHNFCNIPAWDLHQGYLVKVDQEMRVTWEGEPIPFDAEIPMREGWNIITYYPTYNLDSSAPDYYCVSPIIDHVLMAKDGEGRFLNPLFDWGGMADWRESQGYMILVDQDLVFSYPPERENINRQPQLSNRSQLDMEIAELNTGVNMSVLVSCLNQDLAGITLEAVDVNAKTVGLGVFNTQGQCGLAVWGDNAATEAKDGLAEGEAFILKFRDGVQELLIDEVISGNGLVYSENGFIALHASIEDITPIEYALTGVYPNPFNATTTISYSQPTPGNITLSIYNTRGQLVDVLMNQQMPAGRQNVVWEADDASAGVYLVRMGTSGGSVKDVKKVVLVK